MVGAKLLIAFDDDLGHDLEAGLEAQWFAVMDVQVGDLRLRNRYQALLLGLFAEIARNQSFDHVALEVFFEALFDDRTRDMAGAEAWQSRHLLIFLDNDIHFAGDFVGRNFDRDLALDAVLLLRVGGFSFCGTHVMTSRLACNVGPDPRSSSPGPILFTRR